ncbi:MAG: MFS transporter [Clostridia bacterium]|nr:MFS transporter [Clostridia bacterium]
MSLINKGVGLVKDTVGKVRTYWKTPTLGNYMSFKEIAAYSGSGIGAYMIITLGTACLLAANNTLLTSTLGIDYTDMYIMYVIAVIANIPLTGIRASIIDNTRNKAGKYRPYIVTMAIPAAIICNVMVWFPYNKLDEWLGDGMIFGETRGYVAKCAIILLLNFLLHFFYYFFYDAYENLIHVLSPNTYERTYVSSVKSIVYSFAPTIVNLFTPIIASSIFNTNTTDIRVYRLLYPILTVFGLLLCIVVYKHTEEKIVQAKTHVIQIKFIDALKAVAKNKYFWIISLATWVGFLESAYANILKWLHDYGGESTGSEYGLIVTIYGNAALWGMLLAPFCVKKWGKKSVLIATNLLNIVFILMMYPMMREINGATIWLVMGCLYLNHIMAAFMIILNPSIQADIRDYQQYKTGERIDGMFAAVGTIGTVITLLTASVLPGIYEKGGLTKENAALVTSRPEILNRVLGDGKTVGELLQEQLANGQDNYTNASSALYDTDILLSLLKVLVIIAAVGAAMNVVPYIWYDFNEKKQKSVIRVLKIRSMFEDYGNGVLDDGNLVEAVDIIRTSREMVAAQPKEVSKKSWKSIKNKDERKLAKKSYKADLEYNDEIEIAKFVCEELDKFSGREFIFRVEESRKIYAAGLRGLRQSDIAMLRQELKEAKAMPKTDDEEKAVRKAAIEIKKNLISAVKCANKYYPEGTSFVEPNFAKLEKKYAKQEQLESQLKALNDSLREIKKSGDEKLLAKTKSKIKSLQIRIKELTAETKAMSDELAKFNRAAKPYLDAKKLLTQAENYTHYDDISAMYDKAKAHHEESVRLAAEEKARKEAEEKEYAAMIRAQRKNKTK